MSGVRSVPTREVREGREAPISRDVVDMALPYLRALLGLAFVAYSANSTIVYGAGDMMWFWPETTKITITGFSDAYWYAMLLALALFVGEVATGEKYPGVYKMFLLPDAFYTARGIFDGLRRAFQVLLTSGDVIPESAAAVLGTALALPVGFFLGYLIARWGEHLLFGKRRAGARGRREA